MKYQKSVDAIANHIQKEYKGGPKIAKAVKELKLPTILIPGYPTAKAGATAVNPGDVFLPVLVLFIRTPKVTFI